MKSILIIGLGRFGRHIARKLLERGNEVLAVDSQESRAEEALPYIGNIQIGDATNEVFLNSLGIPDFDVCIGAIGDDFQNSLETTSLLKELGAKVVISRASRDVHAKFLLRNGADRVIYPEQETAERLAVTCSADHIFDYIELTPDYSIYEISVPKGWIGKSILQLAVRTKYNISILATKEHGVVHPLPSAEYIFKESESLIVMGKNENVEKLIR